MEMKLYQDLEEKRVHLQACLDSEKTSFERNRMGQFSTPSHLAKEILEFAKSQIPQNESLKFFDPGLGTGSFYSALIRTFPKKRIEKAVGVEIDPHYEVPTRELWKDTSLEILCMDFTKLNPPLCDSERFNLLICNPPYVRHHHLGNEEKLRLQYLSKKNCGIQINGLSGLYCYYITLSHAWMKEKGIAGWLIPTEFMDVNYGESIKRYLLEKVTLLRIHSFDSTDVQFDDALVSSSIVWFKNELPSSERTVELSYGGTLLNPQNVITVDREDMWNEKKWKRFLQRRKIKKERFILSDFFLIKRGLATGDNHFFILNNEQIEEKKLPIDLFKPILPSPRFLPCNEIFSDNSGSPIIDKVLFLLDCNLPEKIIRETYPELWDYLSEGIDKKIHERYICRHRTPWYSQEKRIPAPFVCTYMGRTQRGKKPFRFILNNSNAVAANVYLLLYPKPFVEREMKKEPLLKNKIWEMLNKIDMGKMLNEGRVYGGGLHKLEPKELSNVPADEISSLFSTPPKYEMKQGKFF